jgi:hypothetical protein
MALASRTQVRMYVDGARWDAAAGDVLDAGRHAMESLTEVQTVVIGG